MKNTHTTPTTTPTITPTTTLESKKATIEKRTKIRF